MGTSKSQSSFQIRRVKRAIQTLRIRQHRNVHTGHVVVISSQISVSYSIIQLVASPWHGCEAVQTVSPNSIGSRIAVDTPAGINYYSTLPQALRAMLQASTFKTSSPGLNMLNYMYSFPTHSLLISLAELLIREPSSFLWIALLETRYGFFSQSWVYSLRCPGLWSNYAERDLGSR